MPIIFITNLDGTLTLPRSGTCFLVNNALLNSYVHSNISQAFIKCLTCNNVQEHTTDASTCLTVCGSLWLTSTVVVTAPTSGLSS